MTLDNQDILFASLMGSRSVDLIQNANILNNELANRVLPVIPFLPLKNQNNVLSQKGHAINLQDNWTTRDSIEEQKQFFPLSFSFTGGAGTNWLFPYEPMINISSGNNIVKRNVAKQGGNLIGTIKERWSRKDFDITVTGVLIGSIMQGKPEDCFPKDQLIQLFEFLKHSKEIYIFCHPLLLLGINKVVVEDYSFPFTKGENVQAYELKLTSDYSYNLLIKEEF
ncbi:DUF6046 domain-containing protein [Flavobacterium gilvum]|uniref:DUF6046 domain-containing protein n=1 Tax=Flavobacterium gilvum TaxID=1492737 RepID=A0AAC9I4K6_9FLAO|nr:DUF6046 domain-containing protein [Flavobacterium gilvum]AOW08748.1 hypothetical protein EM308_04105 [Flavobacterium gilvum]KFC59811.1 hypothetical protein FEM08_13220 [Flavobacterium gilvum]